MTAPTQDNVLRGLPQSVDFWVEMTVPNSAPLAAGDTLKAELRETLGGPVVDSFNSITNPGRVQFAGQKVRLHFSGERTAKYPVKLTRDTFRLISRVIIADSTNNDRVAFDVVFEFHASPTRYDT